MSLIYYLTLLILSIAANGKTDGKAVIKKVNSTRNDTDSRCYQEIITFYNTFRRNLEELLIRNKGRNIRGQQVQLDLTVSNDPLISVFQVKCTYVNVPLQN